MPTGSMRFAAQAQKDAKLWLFLLALLASVRIVMMAVYRGQLDRATGGGELARAVVSGLQYDCQVATLFALPALLLSVLCSFAPCEGLADRVRFALGAVLVPLSVVLAGVDIGYVAEFGSQFDRFVFG